MHIIGYRDTNIVLLISSSEERWDILAQNKESLKLFPILNYPLDIFPSLPHLALLPC